MGQIFSVENHHINLSEAFSKITENAPTSYEALRSVGGTKWTRFSKIFSATTPTLPRAGNCCVGDTSRWSFISMTAVADRTFTVTFARHVVMDVVMHMSRLPRT